ncbi:MAG: hypothetical protein RR357_05075 [Clostridia bacterium]
MSSLKLCKLLIKRNKGYALISVFYFAVILLLSAFFVVMLQDFMVNLKFFKPFKNECGAYFSNRTGEPFDYDNSGLAELKSVEMVYSVNSFKVDGSGLGLNYTIYSNYIAHNFKAELSSGKWFTDAPVIEGEINAVIEKRSKQKVGDKISILVNGESYVFNITGILSKNYQCYMPLGYGELDSLKSQQVDDVYFPKIIFSVDGLKPNVAKPMTNLGSIVLFNDNISDWELASNVEILKSSGNAIELSKLYQQEKMVFTDYLKMLAPPIAVIGLLCVFSFIAVMCVYMQKSQSMLNSFMLCGCARNTLIKAICAYFLSCSTISFALYFVILLISSSAFSVNLAIAIIMPVCLLFIILFTALMFGANIYKKGISTHSGGLL